MHSQGEGAHNQGPPASTSSQGGCNSSQIDPTESPRSSMTSNPHSPESLSSTTSGEVESVLQAALSTGSQTKTPSHRKDRIWAFFRFGLARGALLAACGLLGVRLEEVVRKSFSQKQPGLEWLSSGLVQATVCFLAGLSNGFASAIAVGAGSLIPVVTVGTLSVMRQKRYSFISVPQHIYFAFGIVAVCLALAMSVPPPPPPRPSASPPPHAVPRSRDIRQ
eukprot:c1880_g1_i1.p1 GENE.c1880_g1_i1~~c1880_g1_i1.p1  ORF type:complete len:221 (-),score=51.35 c1880_g1_i1:122-784(-)